MKKIIDVEVQGLKVYIEGVALKPHFQSEVQKYTRKYGGPNHGRMMWQTTINKMYQAHSNKGFSVGIGGIEWLNKHSDLIGFNITSSSPEITPMSYSDLEVPERLKNSPKFKVNGRDRFYFFEALEACFKAPRGLVKLPTGCLRADTMIPLLDGTTVPISSLKDREEFWVLSSKEDGTVVPGRGHSARITKTVKEIYEITLSDNSIIHVTGNHPFMMRDGSYKKVEDLEVGVSLMPNRLTTELKNNRPTVRDNRLGTSIRLQHMVANELWPNRETKDHIHHKNHNTKDNTPSNLEKLTHQEHSSHHFREMHKIPNNPLGENLKKFYTNSAHQSYAAKHRSEESKADTKKRLIAYNKSDKGRAESKRRAEHMHSLLRNKTPEEKALIKLKRSIGTVKRNCTYHHKKTPETCDKCRENYYTKLKEIKKIDKDYNHTVKKIEVIQTNEDVWDITVDKYPNFAISTSFTEKSERGIFVHNSGKTEIQLTLSHNQSQKVGTGMILVPTLIIKDQFIERAKKYDIEIIDYRDYTPSHKKGTIFVTTHHIILERLKNKETKKATLEELSTVDWALIDEASHTTSISWFTILMNLPNCQRAHGFSALPVAFETQNGKSFSDLDLDDARTIGVLGEVLYERTANELKDFLNIPILINLKYTWPETHKDYKNPQDWKKVKGAKDWHGIRKAIALNTERTEFISKIMAYLVQTGYKTATFVNSKDHAQQILKGCESSSVACWFGGGVAFTADKTLDPEYVKREFGTDLLGLILTSHGIEGLDFDSPLNGLVLHEGKSVRQTVQKAGRIVRPDSKSSFIINICDRGCTILPKHANIRAGDIIKEFNCESVNCSSFSQFVEEIKILEEKDNGD